MKVYTYSEARQRLADLLDEAQQEGTVRIRRKDGRVFVLQPAEVEDSPLDIPGIPLDITTKEIIDIIRKGRERP
jgi:antitoxin Phd